MTTIVRYYVIISHTFFYYTSINAIPSLITETKCQSVLALYIETHSYSW